MTSVALSLLCFLPGSTSSSCLLSGAPVPWPVPAPTLPLESFPSDPVASAGLLGLQVLGLCLVLAPLLGFLIAPQIPQSRGAKEEVAEEGDCWRGKEQ